MVRKQRRNVKENGEDFEETPTRPTGRKQNEDLCVGAVGGIDRGAIPKGEFDKVKRLEEGEGKNLRRMEVIGGRW